MTALWLLQAKLTNPLFMGVFCLGASVSLATYGVLLAVTSPAIIGRMVYKELLGS